MKKRKQIDRENQTIISQMKLVCIAFREEVLRKDKERKEKEEKKKHEWQRQFKYSD